MVDLLETGLSGLITLAAAFGGIYLGGKNQRRADERAAEREAAAYQREVATRFEQERHRDQLELLRGVQEEVLETARLVTRLLIINQELRREGGDDTAVPSHMRSDLYEARTGLGLHASRLLDDGLRSALEVFLKDVLEAVMHSSVIPSFGSREEAAEVDARRSQSIDTQQEEIIAAIGAAIRAEVASVGLSRP